MMVVMVGYAWIMRPSKQQTARATLTHPTMWNSELLNHFVYERGDMRRDRHAERPGGLAVDGQLRRSLLDRQFACPRALENPVHKGSGAAVELREVLAVGHQASGLHEVALRIDRRKTMLECEPGKLVPLVQKIGIIDHAQGFDTLPVELRERLRKAVRIVRIGRCQGHAGLVCQVPRLGE